MKDQKPIDKAELENMLEQIYNALCEKGYSPSSQLAASPQPISSPVDWTCAHATATAPTATSKAIFFMVTGIIPKNAATGDLRRRGLLW